jgi:hypothetical protein
MLAVINLIILALNVVGLALVAIFGYLFKGYGSEKGKNIAIQENIDKLAEQMRILTDAQKRIEATISHEVWGQQKTWELKRDAALELMRIFGSILEKLQNFFSAATEEKRAETTADAEIKKNAKDAYDDAYKDFRNVLTKFWQQEQIAKLVFPVEIHQKLDAMQTGFFKLLREVVASRTVTNVYASLHAELLAKQEDLAKALRLDLKIP